MIDWEYNDGGRAEAGFKGSARDCVARSAAIALALPYKEVYDELNLIRKELLAKARSPRIKKSLSDSVRNGTAKEVSHEFFRRHGWTWTPTMHIGSGCSMHLSEYELPKGRIVCSVSGHIVAVVDGTVLDTFDPSRDGDRCVYGYWTDGLK